MNEPIVPMPIPTDNAMAKMPYTSTPKESRKKECDTGNERSTTKTPNKGLESSEVLSATDPVRSLDTRIANARTSGEHHGRTSGHVGVTDAIHRPLGTSYAVPEMTEYSTLPQVTRPPAASPGPWGWIIERVFVATVMQPPSDFSKSSAGTSKSSASDPDAAAVERRTMITNAITNGQVHGELRPNIVLALQNYHMFEKFSNECLAHNFGLTFNPKLQWQKTLVVGSLKGIIDVIGTDPNGDAVIIDIKCKSADPVDEYAHQVYAYAAMYTILFGKVSGCQVYNFLTGKKFVMSVNLDHDGAMAYINSLTEIHKF